MKRRRLSRKVLAALPRRNGQPVGVRSGCRRLENSRQRRGHDYPSAGADRVEPGRRRTACRHSRKVHELEPWNESPIVQAILAAKDDVAKSKGAKSIVVLTDGYDNRFAKEGKPAKSIATTLREAFQDTGIVVNVVGFKFVSKEEEDLARRQFKVLTTLTPPGRFFATNEASKLAAELREAYGNDCALLDRPRGQRETAGNTGHRPRIEQRQQQRPLVSLPRIAAAGRLQDARRHQSWKKMLQNVIVNRGELLLLNLVPGANGMKFQPRVRDPRRLWRQAEGESSGDWRLAAVQRPAHLKDRGLQMLLMLDKALRSAPEGDAATDTAARDLDRGRLVGRAERDVRSAAWGYQPRLRGAPAWNIGSLPNGRRCMSTPDRWRNRWSGCGGVRFSTHRPIRSSPAPRNCRRSCTRPTSTARWRARRSVIDRVAVEPQRVETQPGKFEDKRCLVVRVTHPRSQAGEGARRRRYARQVGASLLSRGGQVHGGLFWPIERGATQSLHSRGSI